MDGATMDSATLPATMARRRILFILFPPLAARLFVLLFSLV